VTITLRCGGPTRAVRMAEVAGQPQMGAYALVRRALVGDVPRRRRGDYRPGPDGPVRFPVRPNASAASRPCEKRRATH
jgi:hypothetical protein